MSHINNMEVAEKMVLGHAPLSPQWPWYRSLAVLLFGHELLAMEYINFTHNGPLKKLPFTLVNDTSAVEKHQFHYLHVLLPFLVGLFLILYILGLICHYRSIVLMRGNAVQRGTCRSSSGTSINTEEDARPERGLRKLKRSVSQSTAFKVKRFMSNFTNIDTIQT